MRDCDFGGRDESRAFKRPKQFLMLLTAVGLGVAGSAPAQDMGAETVTAQLDADVSEKADAEARQKAAEVAAQKAAVAAESALKLSLTDRQRLQVALTSLGFDTQGADGTFGPRSREMILGWQKARN